MNSNECPVCGAEDYHYESGWQNREPIEPDEAWCDKCGYRWQEHCKHPESEQIAKFKISKYDDLQAELAKPITEHPDVQESERIINSCKKKWLDYIARKETKDE